MTANLVFTGFVHTNSERMTSGDTPEPAKGRRDEWKARMLHTKMTKANGEALNDR